MDVIVDLRAGSAGFGTWQAVRLDDRDRRAVFLTESLAGALAAGLLPDHGACLACRASLRGGTGSEASQNAMACSRSRR